MHYTIKILYGLIIRNSTNKIYKDYDVLTDIKNSIKHKIIKYCYKYLAINAEKPKFEHQQLTTEGYFSQFGQDKWIIERLFPNKKKRFFVDIGAKVNRLSVSIISLS